MRNRFFAFLCLCALCVLPALAFAQSGTVYVGDNTAGCTGANEGGLRYNTTSKLFEFCNASAWTVVGSGGGSGGWTDDGTVVRLTTASDQVGIGTATMSDASVDLQLHRSSNTAMYITADGDIGTDDYAQLWFALDHNGTPNWAGIGMRNDGSLRFTGNDSIQSATHMLITDSGNVGIGTESPASRLHIAESDTNGPTLVLENTHSTANASALAFDARGSTKWYITTDWDEDGGQDFQIVDGPAGDIRRLVIDANGNVGIGETSPAGKLHVYKSNTTTTNAAEFGMFSQLDVSPSGAAGGNSSWVRSAGRGYAKIPAGNTNTFRKAIGLEGWGENYGTGGDSNGRVWGVYGWAWNNGVATLGSVTGLKGDAEADKGTVTWLMGVDAWVGAYNAGTNVTNLVGVSIDGLDISGATVTNRYGIYLSDYSGSPTTNDYGIYQTGGAKNYFADPVGIGTTSPGVELHVYTSAAQNKDAEIVIETDGTTKASYLTLDDTHTQWGGIEKIANGSSQWFIGNRGGTAGSLIFYTTNSYTPRMTILSGGNVGIGVTGPSHILQINGQGRATNSAWATSSDRRVKKNIKPLGEGLDTIMRLNPVTFEYIDAYKQGKDGMDGMQRGFIAQEVQPVIPEMVKIIDEKFGDQDIKDFHLLTNSDFVPLLVKSVQDLKHENDDLRSELASVKASLNDLDDLRRQISDLKRRVDNSGLKDAVYKEN